MLRLEAPNKGSKLNKSKDCDCLYFGKTIFLTPFSNRAVSGILLESDYTKILLDCGEMSFGQMVRYE